MDNIMLTPDQILAAGKYMRKKAKTRARRAVRKLLFFEFITTPDSFIIAQSEKQRFTNLQKRLIYD